jgi:diguanylate cyclase (GGDEF)-like protein/PAS domain S-box-containing protein
MQDPAQQPSEMCSAEGCAQHPFTLNLMIQVFEASNEAIFICDGDNRIVAANPAFTRLTGYSNAEAVGQNPRFLASGETPQKDYQAMWRALAATGYWQGEILDRRKDGSVYPKLLTISLLRAANGAPENYIAGFSSIADQKEAIHRIAQLTDQDPLTQLPNRSALVRLLQQELNKARRDGRQVAVMLVDMDRFKEINCTLGHHVGDRLLVAVADRLRHVVRNSDIVAHLGGEDFVIVLPDLENALSVAGVASKLQFSLGDHYLLGQQNLYSTPSIGISLFPLDAADAETLILNASAAMRHAKSLGQSKHQFFNEAMNRAASERLALEIGLRYALDTTHLPDSQLRLHFQPQLHWASQRIIGLEALARWTHPELGPISPSRFIPIAEETGLIQPLGDWVFWEACRQLREFINQGVQGVRMAVNLSAQQLRYEGLPSVVRGALACYDLKPSDLELEITESTAMQNPSATIAILNQLCDMGIVLAIDDFGTGYSSLSYLKDLPVHRLKLDQSFVKDIETDKSDAAICSATIVLGHNLQLDLVAEGVETTGQQDYLGKLGCDVLQGFLYSKALPGDQVVAFLKGWPQNGASAFNGLGAPAP